MFNYKKGNVSAKIYRRSHLSSDFAQPAEDTITSAENLSVISIDSPFAPSPLSEEVLLDDDSSTLDNSFGVSVHSLSRDQSCPSHLKSGISQVDGREIVKVANMARHPLYGQLLADLGYKRIYLSSAKTVVRSIPIWHLQRPTDYSRVAEIAWAKTKKLMFPGCISVFEFVGVDRPRFDVPQTFGIFDGQHRVHAAAKILQEKTKLTTSI